MTRMQRIGLELTERQFNRDPFALSRNRRNEESEPSNIKPRDFLILGFLATLACSAIGVWIAPSIQQFIHLLNP